MDSFFKINNPPPIPFLLSPFMTLSLLFVYGSQVDKVLQEKLFPSLPLIILLPPLPSAYMTVYLMLWKNYPFQWVGTALTINELLKKQVYIKCTN
jgi:hypothetical protein